MKVSVNMKNCIIGCQQCGTSDEYMASRVTFDVIVQGQITKDAFVDVKQTVGSNYETVPLEVGKPQGYSGRMNYDSFRDVVERYYRECVGSQGRGFRIAGGASVKIQDCLVGLQRTYVVEAGEQDGGW